jgi:hypothetical protein
MNFTVKIFRKLLLIVSGILVVFFLSFSYGVLVGKNKIFPYRIIISLKNVFAPEPEFRSGNSIETNLLVLNKKTFNDLNPYKFVGYGGGLASFGGNILGVEKDGRFFLYKKSGVVKKLDISIQTNKDLLAKYLAEQVTKISKSERTFIKRHQKMFRVLGIAVKEKDEKVQIFVSYSYWHPDKAGKTIRVSRLVVDDISDILEGKKKVDTDEWEIIYETRPVIVFSDNYAIFRTNRSAGRLVFDSEDSLIVGFGDQALDGYTADVDVIQDDNTSFGKLIRIDLKTLGSWIFARGIRNPQGLHIDRDGNIWETEHGPKGGDELNLIHEGKNYGWPLVTYGTQYEQYEWPLSKNQGRHEGFERPIFAWVPSIGISNVIQIKDTPQQWDGDLLVSSLKQGTLYRMRIHDRRVILSEPILVGERIRDLIQMNDGTILLWTDNAHFIELTVQEKPVKFRPALTEEEIAVGLDKVIQDCSECHSFTPAHTGENVVSLIKKAARGLERENA